MFTDKSFTGSITTVVEAKAYLDKVPTGLESCSNRKLVVASAKKFLNDQPDRLHPSIVPLVITLRDLDQMYDEFRQQSDSEFYTQNSERRDNVRGQILDAYLKLNRCVRLNAVAISNDVHRAIKDAGDSKQRLEQFSQLQQKMSDVLEKHKIDDDVKKEFPAIAEFPIVAHNFFYKLLDRQDITVASKAVDLLVAFHPSLVQMMNTLRATREMERHPLKSHAVECLRAELKSSLTELVNFVKTPVQNTELIARLNERYATFVSIQQRLRQIADVDGKLAEMNRTVQGSSAALTVTEVLRETVAKGYIAADYQRCMDLAKHGSAKLTQLIERATQQKAAIAALAVKYQQLAQDSSDDMNVLRVFTLLTERVHEPFKELVKALNDDNAESSKNIELIGVNNNDDESLILFRLGILLQHLKSYHESIKSYHGEVARPLPYLAILLNKWVDEAEPLQDFLNIEALFKKFIVQDITFKVTLRKFIFLSDKLSKVIDNLIPHLRTNKSPQQQLTDWASKNNLRSDENYAALRPQDTAMYYTIGLLPAIRDTNNLTLADALNQALQCIRNTVGSVDEYEKQFGSTLFTTLEEYTAMQLRRVTRLEYLNIALERYLPLVELHERWWREYATENATADAMMRLAFACIRACGYLDVLQEYADTRSNRASGLMNYEQQMQVEQQALCDWLDTSMQYCRRQFYAEMLHYERNPWLNMINSEAEQRVTSRENLVAELTRMAPALSNDDRCIPGPQEWIVVIRRERDLVQRHHQANAASLSWTSMFHVSGPLTVSGYARFLDTVIDRLKLPTPVRPVAGVK